MTERYPSEWSEVRYEDVASIIGGATPDTENEEYWGGDIEWVIPSEVTDMVEVEIEGTERKLTEDGFESTSTTIISENSVLMTSRATVGVPVINNVPMATNQGFQNFDFSEYDKVNHYFFYYHILHNRDYIDSLASGGTFGEISKSELSKLKFNCPPVDEQERVASVLYTVDSKVERLEQRYERLERLKQALMQDLLTGEKQVDEDTTVLSDVLINSSPTLINRDLSWRAESARDVFTSIESGLSYDGEDEVEDQTENSVPLAGTGAIKNQSIQSQEISYIENVDEEKIENLSLNEGDVLIVAASGSDERLGEAITIEDDLDILFGTFVTRLTSSDINPYYLGYYINSNQTQERLDGLARGSTSLKNLNKSDLQLMDIEVPPQWEQERIASVLYTVDEMLEKTDELISQHERLKRGLMQDLLSGDVRTPADLKVLDEVVNE